MKVKMLKGAEIRNVNDSYGLRLIEQGKAVAVREAPKKSAKKDVAKPGDA